MAAKRTVAAFKLEPHQREGLELLAASRGVNHHEITGRAVVAYVACMFDPDHRDRHADIIARTDAEPDLRAWHAGGEAFRDGRG